ncbi:MAG TPA: type II toxin-antitoxin system HigB family toxin [Candidatus Angelobacter sp.]
MIGGHEELLAQIKDNKYMTAESGNPACCHSFANCEVMWYHKPRFISQAWRRNDNLRVISRKKLREAANIHADSAISLDAWYRVAKGAKWKSFAELRLTWSSADIYGDCTIFNIKGNRYRLIAWVNYQTQKMFVRQVLTHAEYTKGGWKRDCSGE